MKESSVPFMRPFASLSIPTPAMGGTRYVRYIAIAVICLIVLIFISSTSSVPGTSIRSGSDKLHSIQDTWRTHTSKPDDVKADETLHGSPEESIMAEIEQSKLTQAESSQKKPSERPSKGGKESTKPTKGKSSSKESAKTPNNPSKLSGPTSDKPRMNATFVSLARNSDVWDISKSIRSVEDRFNHRFNYDWVFLNDKEFDDTFKRVTTSLTSGRARYGLVPEAHWSFPEWIDLDKAAEARKDMADKKIIYGDSVSYRHMCRYESGFFFRHPIMNEYEWYWRVEPNIELFCDVEYDTFEYMEKNNKTYSFTISLYEYGETIETLWDSVKKFMRIHPEHVAENNLANFITEDDGESYNRCHFWSNFEIGSLKWLRSKSYLDYFTILDNDGGFFYERWGDAPVHSIAAALMLNQEQIHFFEDIAYSHSPFTHCPTDEKMRTEKRCNCNPDDNFDWKGYSCTARYYDVKNKTKPAGYEDQL